MLAFATQYIFYDRPTLGWTVEHIAYPPLGAGCNPETILLRYPKEYGAPHRSPKLYTFDEEAYKDAKKIGMRLEF